jgi:hypothetical protein
MERDRYKGVPLGDLKIEHVTWTEERSQHIRTRTIRYDKGETNLEPEWVTESVNDRGRVVAVAGDKEETSSIKLVGYSTSLATLLKVWIWSDDPAGSDVWIGGSASLANPSDRNRYQRGGTQSDH